MNVEVREDLENIIDAGDASESALAFDLLQALEENERLRAALNEVMAVSRVVDRAYDIARMALHTASDIING